MTLSMTQTQYKQNYYQGQNDDDTTGFCIHDDCRPTINSQIELYCRPSGVV